MGRINFDHKSIIEFWQKERPELFGMYDSNNPRVCFACGIQCAQTQRCHIVALADGGDDLISNIHILCPICHHVSEFMSKKGYWRWIESFKPEDVVYHGFLHAGYPISKIIDIYANNDALEYRPDYVSKPADTLEYTIMNELQDKGEKL